MSSLTEICIEKGKGRAYEKEENRFQEIVRRHQLEQQRLPRSRVSTKTRRRQRQSHYLELPLELRLMIYDLLLKERVHIVLEHYTAEIRGTICQGHCVVQEHHDSEDSLPEWDMKWVACGQDGVLGIKCRVHRRDIRFQNALRSWGAGGLARVCKQMYDEMLEPLYATPTFVFHDLRVVPLFFKSLPRWKRAWVKNVDMYLTLPPTKWFGRVYIALQFSAWPAACDALSGPKKVAIHFGPEFMILIGQMVAEKQESESPDRSIPETLIELLQRLDKKITLKVKLRMWRQRMDTTRVKMIEDINWDAVKGRLKDGTGCESVF